MKKKLAILLTAVVLGSSLAGCGSEDDGAERIAETEELEDIDESEDEEDSEEDEDEKEEVSVKTLSETFSPSGDGIWFETMDQNFGKDEEIAYVYIAKDGKMNCYKPDPMEHLTIGDVSKMTDEEIITKFTSAASDSDIPELPDSIKMGDITLDITDYKKDYAVMHEAKELIASGKVEISAPQYAVFTDSTGNEVDSEAIAVGLVELNNSCKDYFGDIDEETVAVFDALSKVDTETLYAEFQDSFGYEPENIKEMMEQSPADLYWLAAEVAQSLNVAGNQEISNKFNLLVHNIEQYYASTCKLNDPSSFIYNVTTPTSGPAVATEASECEVATESEVATEYDPSQRHVAMVDPLAGRTITLNISGPWNADTSSDKPGSQVYDSYYSGYVCNNGYLVTRVTETTEFALDEIGTPNVEIDP